MKREALAEFVLWAQANVTGDEKGQAQVFLDHLFQACGHAGGSLAVADGAPEFRIRRSAESGGGIAFADFVWKPVVLIEMKRRGTDLQKHYRQAFDYWTRLVPNRPRYVILCNFDEFRVYDFETQMDAPVDTVALVDLPERYGALAFLAPGNPEPTFGNDRVAVTRQAADKLAACFTHLADRGVERELAQRFILQTLVALFAEDIGLLDKYFVARLLADCAKASDSFDLLGGLFAAMNSVRPAQGGHYKGVPYFNGGLFAKPAAIELDIIELNLLRDAAAFDWSKVQPEIFGTLFQHSLAAGERHALGAHFTHPADIMKIVGPTIVEPWREQIEGAKTLARLHELQNRLHDFRVLDPACGSGNFLYIAYRELKRLEARLFERIAEFRSQAEPGQLRLSFLSAQNFYGLDIQPFAVEIAKVTMMIARKLAIDEVHVTEKALPLDNLDANFVAVDALLLEPGGFPTPWPKADVIIGNPPFLGAKRLKPERGPDYVNRLRAAYPEVPGMADYCVYWLRRAHEHLPPCTAADPVAGRAGLVGTQNIRNNQSRVGGLDHIVKDGTIVEAVENQPWSGEANVHVSIVNWVKTQDPALLPKTRRLWFEVPQGGSGFQAGVSREGKRGAHGLYENTEQASSLLVHEGEPPSTGRVPVLLARRKRGEGPAGKQYELDFRACPHINSALSDGVDISGRNCLTCNQRPKCVFQGKVLGYDGFLLDASEAARVAVDSADVVVPFLTGRELLDDFAIRRWVIDFRGMPMGEAAARRLAFEHCRLHVLPAVQRSYEAAHASGSDMAAARREHLDRWWQFWNRRDELTAVMARTKRYIACSRVTRRPIMVFVSSTICPSDALQVFAFDDDYSFGILQSALHFEWFRTSSRLKVESDLRYSSREIFETFPWPQTPSAAQVAQVAAAAREVRRVRAETMRQMGGGLRDVYRMLELPGKNPLHDAHGRLDTAVMEAYGFHQEENRLGQVLALNRQVGAAEGAGQLATAPGLPAACENTARLTSDDCLNP